MKQIANVFLLLFFTSILSTSVNAQSLDEFAEVVFVTAYDGFKNAERAALPKRFNAVLKESVKEYWDLDIEPKFMEEKEAYKYAKSAKGILIAEFTSMSPSSGIGGESTLDFRNGKGQKKILSLKMPAFVIQKADMVYALMHGQFMLSNLNKFKNPTKDLPKLYGHLLKEKILLIDEEHLARKFNAKKMAEVYPYKFEVVSQERIHEAIESKDETHLVLLMAQEGGNVTQGNFPFWNIYQPSDGTVVSRHAGDPKGLMASDIAVFVKRTQ